MHRIHQWRAILLILFLCGLSGRLASGEGLQVGGWQATGTLAAPEANQAVAAHEQHLFAIGNKAIAKYDRRSGMRLATSTGEATHLNSGFVWERQILCAHSNYPQTPEQSEIKVLKMDTMQLSTFKDFGNFGGSLTWVVRQKDHWWCNFARYGEDNAQTFLVKFDTQWKELARWTYPREVLDELGKYSLSGGLWSNDTLLVTGHDDPILFRLRIPQQGTALEFIGKESIPFTGQGIAVDPQTGGLVGINRAKRQIVFAMPDNIRQ